MSQTLKKPDLFYDERGAQMQVYIAVNDIPERPKVARLVKNNGGLILSDARNADVILIAPSTDDGRQLLRLRGHSQPVLNYEWVRACVKTGRMLGMEDGWGGYLVHDDGVPITSTDDHEEAGSAHHPLPTPRVTPTIGTSSNTGTSMSRPLHHNNKVPNHPTIPPASALITRPPTVPTTSQISYPLGMSSTPPSMDPSQLNSLMSFFPNASMFATFMHMASQFQASGSGAHLATNNLSQALTHNAMAAQPAFPVNNSDATYHDEGTRNAPSYSQKGKAPEDPATLSGQWRSQSTGNVSSGQPIFVTPRGKALNFYVQIDMKDRQSIVSKIKKHGGSITSESTAADYVVLYHDSTSYSQILAGALKAGKPAVKAAFVLESVSKGQLLDPTPWLHDAPVPRRPKRTASDTTKHKRAKRRVSAQASEHDPALQLGIRSAARKNRSPSVSLPRTTPSPTPPPESSRVSFPGGKYRYSEEECAYILKYSEYLLQQNPSMSYQQLGHKFFSKLPHHTLSSWTQHLQNLKDDIEAIRKRAGINQRKVQHEQQSPKMKRESPPGITQANVDPLVDPFETDLEHICRFFANGEGDGISDDEAWKRLSQQATCLTASSWPAFYLQHHQRALERIRELTLPIGSE